MKYTYTPTSDNVLVEPFEATQTHTGIILTGDLKAYPKTGKVLAVGPGKISKKKTLIEPEVKVGDIVYYPRDGKEVKEVSLEGKNYNIVSEEFIFGVE